MPTISIFLRYRCTTRLPSCLRYLWAKNTITLSVSKIKTYITTKQRSAAALLHISLTPLYIFLSQLVMLMIHRCRIRFWRAAFFDFVKRIIYIITLPVRVRVIINSHFADLCRETVAFNSRR